MFGPEYQFLLVCSKLRYSYLAIMAGLYLCAAVDGSVQGLDGIGMLLLTYDAFLWILILIVYFCVCRDAVVCSLQGFWHAWHVCFRYDAVFVSLYILLRLRFRCDWDGWGFYVFGMCCYRNDAIVVFVDMPLRLRFLCIWDGWGFDVTGMFCYWHDAVFVFLHMLSRWILNEFVQYDEARVVTDMMPF